MSDIFHPSKNLKEEFHCPHCGVFAKQRWARIYAKDNVYPSDGGVALKSFAEGLGDCWAISKCDHCRQYMIWFEGFAVHPTETYVEQPNNDMSPDIKRDYMEAAKVLHYSPRASAALLRLALQKLCLQLGEKGEVINDDIAGLVQKGLSPTLQKAMDSLRITGNNAVHPGRGHKR